MKIALVGATGYVGTALLAEAAARGHRVTAIARRIDALTPSANIFPARADIGDEANFIAALRGHEAVISATKFLRTNPQAMVRAIKDAGVPRWLVVGGAGSLEVSPGSALVDTPDFPAEYRAEADAGRNFLNALRREAEIDWTLLSPSALLLPGARTGKFRLGGDRLLVDAAGESRISVADYAAAMIDELEQPRHWRRRFTVGY